MTATEPTRYATVTCTVDRPANDPDARVRLAAARNRETPASALEKLSNDASGEVVDAVAANPAISDELFVDMYENPRVKPGSQLFEALYSNGPRGAYARTVGGLSRAVLYLTAALFLVFNVGAFFGGGMSFGRTFAPHDPRLLEAALGPVVAMLFARLLHGWRRLTPERLRARSVLPRVATWLARGAIVAVIAWQIRASVM